MNILILLSNPFKYRQFDRAIDHNKHKVYYFGTKKNLETVPTNFKSIKFTLPDEGSFSKNAAAIVGMNRKFDKIIAPWEDVIMEGAKLRELWNIVGPKVKDIVKVTDKKIMKECIVSARLKVPETYSLKKFFGEDGTRWSWTGKTVLKPRAEAASRGIKIFESFKEAVNFLMSRDERERKIYSESYELEKFVDAPIYNANGLVESGKVVCRTVGRYAGTNFEYSKGCVAASVLLNVDETLSHWIQSVITAVGIENGAFHLEFFYSNAGPIFLEIANRCGGGPFVEEFELKTGIYLPAAENSVYIGDSSLYDWKKHYKESALTFGCFCFPGHHLREGYARFENIDFLLTHPALVEAELLPVGDKLPRDITYQKGRCPIWGIVKGESENSVASVIDEIVKKVRVFSVPVPQ